VSGLADSNPSKRLREEWHALVKELDEVFEDGLRLSEQQETWKLWDRAARIRRRIAEIAATGVSFDE
jgi:hypothetical protein